jgi:hypothetical protein
LVIRIDHVEEALEEPDLSSFLAEELENCFPFLLDRWAGTGRYGCGGGEADVQLIMEEIRDFLMDAEEAVPGIERRDGVGGVGLGGRGHGRCCCCEVVKADC